MKAVLVGVLACTAAVGCRPRKADEPPRCATQSDAEPARLRDEVAALDGWATTPRRDHGSVTVRVYFHVIQDGKRGAVGAKALERQLEVLNIAFARTAFRFVEADDNKYPLEYNTAWHYMHEGSQAEKDAKRKLHQGTPEDLNVYFVEPPENVIGWSTWPWRARKELDQDGVVLLYTATPNGGKKGHDAGDKLVHEVGHWLGLYHTFEKGCDPPGDRIDATPAEMTSASSCAPKNTCPSDGVDPVDNFMNYADDACMTKFLEEQEISMDDNHLFYRSKATEALLLLLDRLHLIDASSQVHEQTF